MWMPGQPVGGQLGKGAGMGGGAKWRVRMRNEEVWMRA